MYGSLPERPMLFMHKSLFTCLFNLFFPTEGETKDKNSLSCHGENNCGRRLKPPYSPNVYSVRDHPALHVTFRKLSGANAELSSFCLISQPVS